MTAVVAQYRGTEPPPGYEWSGDSRDLVHAVGRPGGPPLHGPVSLSQAWSEYRITHDPPGMWSSPTFKGSFGVLQSPSPSARGHDGQLILIKTTLRVVPSGWTCTITNVGSKPYKVVPSPIDSGVASPVSGGVDVGATDTIVRVGSGWRPRRIKLRSWLLPFDDWSRGR